MRLIAGLLLLAAACPVSAAVWEVGADGSLDRLDTQPVAATPVTAAPVAPRANRFHPQVKQAGDRYALSPALIDAIAHVESRYRADAVSRAGARGIMQLMPGTARDLGVDATDAGANIRGGTAYLRQLLDRFDGDVVRTIAAYNAGPGAVLRAGGVPRYAETRAYVAAVLDRLAAGAR
ncbi:lytic transglycosylase domain-containing protein [Glacieibacterium frigidum]|uniref:Lytic transglycosylase domain-containing protein n=1 Tax=Glacieibacterium frigidum TaxID=2593303 RepID=A0A552UH24_9SPHN|nr:lytic transglycosylase domain-containing protein [Glacieibacterium frigidum]TRW17519.1 lytic transglycosylase domain-containing protein [Glacieibacterium frigidum]